MVSCRVTRLSSENFHSSPGLLAPRGHRQRQVLLKSQVPSLADARAFSAEEAREALRTLKNPWNLENQRKICKNIW